MLFCNYSLILTMIIVQTTAYSGRGTSVVKKKSLVLDQRKQKIKTEFLWQVVPLLGSAEEKKILH